MAIVDKQMEILGKQQTFKVIEGVKFGKIALKLPDSKIGSGDKVFKVEFFVDKATCKELKKKYKKMSIEEIDNDDIQRRFHFDPPFPDQDEQFKVSLSVKAIREKKSDKSQMELWKPEFMEMVLRPKVYDKATGENLTAKHFFENGAVGDVWVSQKELVMKENNTEIKFTHLYFQRIELDSYTEYQKKS